MNMSPTIELNNGTRMPALGLGVLDRPTRELTAGAVTAAVTAGYRMVDTAAVYLNERDVGEGLRRSGIDRSEVFVQSKLWVTDYGYDGALRGFEASLRRMGLEYIDLYLLHWPVPAHFDATIAAYQALERVLREGQAKAIGVSNFSPVNLATLVERTSVVPAVNQIELHPSFTQRQLRETNARLGIVTQAWSPIGGTMRRGNNSQGVDPLSHPTVGQLAAKYKKTAAQIIIRWHMQHGHSAIPKSFRPERIVENFHVFDFALTAEESAAIDAMDTGRRSGADPEVVSPETMPLRVED
jgi:diketogulonate reductase-like aldo/keto reductase